ncbi:succinate CoA transferase [Raineyella fluvialis]|uniref:Succinate CoA transferase n=1 Tax=Raineyella fluvialis TaxID=2662261 RepID=A0A5Q2F9U7_9ACTN|nr:succinate CoA transferase [Raineyella fluvialis]QGF23672.1 succinate CoA transferase [Raineyella fluvialis]
MGNRIHNAAYQSKVMSAEDAAALVNDGDMIGVSGFTGSGYPKAVPIALAARAKALHAAGTPFRVSLSTGASTAPELDGELADANAVNFRTPYQSDPETRKKINTGEIQYADIHLSHIAPQFRNGFHGRMNLAIIELTAIKADGSLVPSSSIGNNQAWLDIADKVIFEVNSWQSEDLEGMHDILGGIKQVPLDFAIPIYHSGDRPGSKYLTVDPAKVIAVVENDTPDRNSPFKPLDDVSKSIAGHLLDFLDLEEKAGRLPNPMPAMQSGVGNVANAVLAGLLHGQFENLTSYTEVIQDGMVDLIDAGKLEVASATAFSLSPEYAAKMNDNAKFYREKIILRNQEVSNNPEVIRRLGVIAMNGMIEADLYGNVNSTHIMGSRMQNGIGGSGDFARNAALTVFVSPSVAKGGAISAIVPMVSHVDHTEHDTDLVITEYGVADLRGKSPRQRVSEMIKVAHPDYRAMLQDYYDVAVKVANGQHTPHDLSQALSWHQRMLSTGTMKA